MHTFTWQARASVSNAICQSQKYGKLRYKHVHGVFLHVMHAQAHACFRLCRELAMRSVLLSPLHTGSALCTTSCFRRNYAASRKHLPVGEVEASLQISNNVTWGGQLPAQGAMVKYVCVTNVISEVFGKMQQPHWPPTER